ncbi:hypothetical protein KKH27_00015 [bacterium]|nr:hypothetical protein [bacterium]MBU1984808.1 hypothetical protein [bacterium]
MGFSIVDVLYEWMCERRIITAVAQQMGVSEATLSAELRRRKSQAKLGADELIPLFNAIRAIGYGDELKGIVHRFIRELRGEELSQVPDRDIVPLVLELTRGLGILSECAAAASRADNKKELETLRRMVRHEILPVVLRMESLIEHRLQQLERTHAGAVLLPVKS